MSFALFLLLSKLCQLLLAVSLLLAVPPAFKSRKNPNPYVKGYFGGAGYRSRYLSHAKRALYHLSYAPVVTYNKIKDRIQDIIK